MHVPADLQDSYSVSAKQNTYNVEIYVFINLYITSKVQFDYSEKAVSMLSKVCSNSQQITIVRNVA